jgi:3-phosphoshikimate 1-carboxyvinyltransferase
MTTMELVTRPSGPLRGTITVPGDKSITHRAIILSALAEGESTIHNYCRGADCLHTAQAFAALGIPVEIWENRIRIGGKGLDGLSEPEHMLDCGNSGTGIRLITGVLAGQSFFSILSGDESIRRRPMGRIVKPLRQMGAVIAGRRGGELAPLALTGSRLRGIHYVSPVASAQVKSSLLLAGLFAEGDTIVTEPGASRDHTERMFTYLGLPMMRQDRSVTIRGRSTFKARDLAVPGDISSAAFFLVAASIVPDSDVTITSVGINPTRIGVLTILREMGARIEVLNEREEAGEPVADLRVRHAQLHGTNIGAARIPETIDELPILCLAAACAEGETVISGAAELRVKESDRIATMATELGLMGAQVQEQPDGLRVLGGRGLHGARCQSYGDHRVAMTMAIAGLVAQGETRVEDTACITTSFPDFDKYLKGLLTPQKQG